MAQAISYTRFSALHQGKGSTSARQHELIDLWLEKFPDVVLSRFSRDDTGKSGFKGDHLNHGLGQILNAIEEGHIRKGDFILVEAIDRIGRLKMWDMFDIFKKIISAGVIIETLEDEQSYSEETLNTNSHAIFILIGKIQQAHAYSANLSRLVSKANEEKRRKARAGEKIKRSAPFWLTSTGEIIEGKGEIVLACIALYLKGRGTKKVIQELLPKYPDLRSKHPTTLKRWFNNRALLGEWKTKGEYIQNVFEPLIDQETFFKLQRELKLRSKNMSPEQTYHLSGLVHCKNCGSRFYFRRKKYKGNLIIYSNCSTYLKRGPEFCKNNKTWPYEVLKTELISGSPILLGAFIWREQKSKLSERVEDLKTEKSEKSKQIDILIAALITVPEQQNIVDKISVLQKDISMIEEEIFNIGESIINDPSPANTVDDEIIDSSNIRQQEIESDPILYRESLKKAGFKILVDGNTLTTNTLEPERTIVTLMRRSTRHNCYVLQIKKVKHQIFNEETDEFDTVPAEYFYMAVDRLGIRATGYTEDQLIYRLINNKDHENLLKYPNE